jgi:hypothetical protein
VYFTVEGKQARKNKVPPQYGFVEAWHTARATPAEDPRHFGRQVNFRRATALLRGRMTG